MIINDRKVNLKYLHYIALKKIKKYEFLLHPFHFYIDRMIGKRKSAPLANSYNSVITQLIDPAHRS